MIQIRDLAITPQPFAVVQDLNYALLLEHYGPQGVPHFRTLSRSRLQQLHERQLQVYAHSARVFPMSKWLANSLAGLGIPANRIDVVNPGINAIVTDKPIPERRLSQQRRLLFIGRDFDTKAGDQVVAAFEILRRELGPAIELTIIGPPTWPLRSEIPPGANFMGPVTAKQVAEELDRHDLFVMPSRFEGFGIAFAEALVRGLPCIGRNACAMPEIITPGDGGLLVGSDDPSDLAELIVKALADDNLYAACAAAAPIRAAHYTWDRAARQMSTSILPLINSN